MEYYFSGTIERIIFENPSSFFRILLLGDDRIVSKDSRQVGAFKKEQIKGQAVFRLWPIYPFKTY